MKVQMLCRIPPRRPSNSWARAYASILGHSGIQVTSKYYTRIYEDVKRESLDRMGAALAATGH